MTIPPSELEQTIRRARQGNDAAVACLYEAHVDQIYRYILYRVPDDVAEDLTAEVFIKMVESLPSYKITGAPFEAWLYRIAAARVADYYRRHKRRQHVELTENLTQGKPSPEERMLEKQELDDLRDALEKLSADQKAVLVLRFVERKSHDEVSEIIGKSVSAVKSIQHRALTRLATLLGSETKARSYLRGQND